jgi:spore coat protein A
MKNDSSCLPCGARGPHASTASKLLDPLSQPKFVYPLPHSLDRRRSVFTPASHCHYEIGAYQFEQALGLVDPSTRKPLRTVVWGYGNAASPMAQPPTYPGRSFEVRRGQPITVRWSNRLVDATGHPLPHLLPVDTSIHRADPLGEHAGQQQAAPHAGHAGPVPVVTHLHGGHTEWTSDGYPEAWFTPGSCIVGPYYNPDPYVYDNDQEAGNLWYHDHALGITRLNVYAGLVGFYLIRDDLDTGRPDNPLGLPAHPYEVTLVIQDRMFTDRGQLFYPSNPPTPEAPSPSILPEFFGDFILVNGKAWPKLEVEPRKYRFRMLNGSDSRFYTLRIEGPRGGTLPIHQIGVDNGLLAAPVTLDTLTLAPGERADVVIDFAGREGQTLVVHNEARAPFPTGKLPDPRTTGLVMAFEVSRPLNRARPDSSLPRRLRPSPFAVEGPVTTTRALLLMQGKDRFGRQLPLLGTIRQGGHAWSDPITENPMLDDVEIWELYNTTNDTHSIHLHLVSFEVVDRQRFAAHHDPVTGALSNVRLIGDPTPPAPNERGPKDIVHAMPHEVTRIKARFDRKGLYVWHCHLLSHEDHDMMRPYHVGPMP